MTQTRNRSIRNPAARALAVGAALSLVALVATAAPTRAACTFVGALGLTPSGEGSDSLVVGIEEDLIFWGYFVPNETVELTFTFNGQPYGDYTPGLADAEGHFMFVHDFQPHMTGEWTITAGVAETECAGTVTVTVTDTSSPATGPAMPDTAMAPSGR